MARIFFLIRSLGRGGAERQLVELARALAKESRDYEVTVCTFYDDGALRSELEDVPRLKLISLGKQSRWDVGTLIFRLLRTVREAQPDIIHGYLPVGNELALLAGQVARAKVVLGLRSSNMDFSRYDMVAKRMFQLGALASHLADAVIVNSEAGRAHHASCGYAADHMVVIPNGIDHERYKPDRDAGLKLRQAWGIAANERVVGLAARADPKKDHETFLRAASQLAARHPSVRFLCVGDSAPRRRDGLLKLAAQLGLAEKLVWGGLREDMGAVYNAFDIGVLSSAFGEGFPNTVAEAMAAQRPCVVTAVGDSALVVGDTGVVVPPGDPAAFARGVEQLLTLSDAELATRGAAARHRVVSLFNRERLVRSTENVFRELLQRS